VIVFRFLFSVFCEKQEEENIKWKILDRTR